MKLIITGGKRFKPDVNSSNWLMKLLKELNPEEVISGSNRGADKFGEEAAKSLSIQVKRFIPDWEKYEKSADFVKNEEMAIYADACVLFPGDAETRHMKKVAEERGLGIYEYSE